MTLEDENGVAEVDRAATLAPLRQFRQRLTLYLLVVGALASLVLWEALRRIVLVPVAALAAGARRVAADDYAAYVQQAINHYGGRSDFPLLQVVWPDKQGRFPWDTEAEHGLAVAQPALCEPPGTKG